MKRVNYQVTNGQKHWRRLTNVQPSAKAGWKIPESACVHGQRSNTTGLHLQYFRRGQLNDTITVCRTAAAMQLPRSGFVRLLMKMSSLRKLIQASERKYRSFMIVESDIWLSGPWYTKIPIAYLIRNNAITLESMRRFVLS